MTWESKTVEDMRREFVEAAKSGENLSRLCREFGISRPTAYKWISRYDAHEPLTDKSKSPHTLPNKTPDEIEQLILSVRDENPGWGGKTIHQVLLNQGYEGLPCSKTVSNILKRNSRISPEESLKHIPFKRFERDKCNQMWQTDFKGEFPTADGKYCFPLNIIDDHSRFLIKIAPHTDTANVVLPAFENAFYEFGKPDSVLSDNGSQFSGFKHGYTQFEKWLMNNNVLPIHCRIKHPQTQGKIERFHGTMKRELLNHKTFSDIEDANKELQEWRLKYNNLRPHEALNMKTPAEVYSPSEKIYTGKIDKYEYDGQYHVIKVNSWGYLRFDKWQVYLSETMIGEYIEFRPDPLGNSFIACYRNFKIAEFDAHTGERINRNISRL